MGPNTCIVDACLEISFYHYAENPPNYSAKDDMVGGKLAFTRADILNIITLK